MIISKSKIIPDSNTNLCNNTNGAATDNDDDVQLENQLVKLVDHAKMARAQRSECNEWVRLARESKEENSHFYCSNFCITVDFTQI